LDFIYLRKKGDFPYNRYFLEKSSLTLEKILGFFIENYIEKIPPAKGEIELL
jgi:hypothetical protein